LTQKFKLYTPSWLNVAESCVVFFSPSDDLVGPNEDLSGVAIEEDSLQQELQASLNKTRRLQQKQHRKLGVNKVRDGMLYVYGQCNLCL
jgi:hypothetical protein